MELKSGGLPQPRIHPADESLVAYLAATLEQPESETVAAHLRSCDRCVDLLVVVQQRLALESAISAKVPSQVLLRAGRPLVVETLLPEARKPGLGERLREWVGSLIEIRVLAPASFAVGVLLMIGIQGTLLDSTPQPHQGRGIDIVHPATIKAPVATLRSEPRPSATSLGNVERGAVVTVHNEQGNWILISLASGTQGWVERQAVE